MKTTINSRKAAIVAKCYASTGDVFVEESFKNYDAAQAYAELLNNNLQGARRGITYRVFVQDPDDYSDFLGVAMVCYLSYDEKSVFCKKAFTDIRAARGAACALDNSSIDNHDWFIMVEDGTKID